MTSRPPPSPAIHKTPRRIRVLQVIGSMHLGGAERVVANLMDGLDADRFEVSLCCTKQLGVLGEDLRARAYGVTVAAWPQRWLRHVTPLFLLKDVWRFRPDVVHSHGTTALWHTGPLGFIRSLPAWVHTFHFGNYDAMTTRQLRNERMLAWPATQLVAVSDPQRRSVIERHGVAPARIETIVNGVRLNPFLSDPNVAERKRAEFGFGPDDIVVGTIAVLSEQKGITHLLSAARTLADRDPRLRFLIVGGGPLESALREQANDLGSRVVLTGSRKDSAELMMALDVFVMSSLWEAMPMVLLEAMAARRAIVVTDVGHNRAVVGDGRCGVVIPPRDANAIATAVSNMVSNPQQARALGEAAGHEYGLRYSIDRMCRNHESLYRRLVHVPDQA